ncbi:general transcription factor IIH subunit 1-like [Paramacrobiotus metropolitanus]|uniref:general transcription factor IIH subunit 1-like n=1 Tax=Paramacrobiotus metropolitanus TaxID=2943436 RepID=UPI0024457032|nr:general transcription factor IIH subunit 1-like [Paramacrobiotus metropolitanus]
MARSSKSNGHGEEILLVIEQVRHQNQKGSLYMTSQNLAFQIAGKDNFDKTYHYSNIKMQKISAEGKSKVQLQIILQNDESFNFHFINAKGQADQLKDRNSVKELLMQLLPKFKRKINKELEDKNKLLRENPRLFQLYKDLVVNGLMTADEFWAHNADKLRNLTGNSGQDTGISAAFLADVVPKVDGTNSMRYNLTPEIIQSIFKTYPAVKKRHAELVPDQLTEQDFWVRFFQSHYFHRDRAVDRASDNIFGDAAVMEEKELLESSRRGIEDSSANIKSLSDGTLDDEEGFGMNVFRPDTNEMASAKNQKRSVSISSAQLIQRFNQHSTRILNTTEARKSTLFSAVDSQPSTPGSSSVNVMDVREDTYLPPKFGSTVQNELEILQNDTGPSRASLNLKKTDRYHRAPSKKRPLPVDRRHVEKRHESLKAHVRDMTIKRRMAISSKMAMQALHDVANEKNRRQTGIDSHLPEPLREEIRGVYASLAEILRHYWACYPVTDRALGEKLARMKKTIEKFQQERLKPLAERAQTEGYPPQILVPLYEMIKAADLRYATQMKKSS